MSSAFIFHGTGGFPEENWFPWLKKELEKANCKVIVPQFPTPKNQTLENWLKVLGKFKEFYTENTILIGHSLGGTFLLKVLEKYKPRIKSSFIVAAPIYIPPIKNYATDKAFLGDDFQFDWKQIRNKCKKFYVFHSDNDPYVSLENGKELSKKLNTELIFIKNAGHFNTSSGFKQFKELLEKIKNEL